MARAHRTCARLRGEDAVIPAPQVGETHARPDRQRVVAREPLPERDEVLLLVLEPLESPVQRKMHRLRHDHLLAGVGRHRPAQSLRLVDHIEGESQFLRPQRAAHSCRSGAHDEQIEHAVRPRAAMVARAPLDRIGHRRAVAYGVPDEREPRDFSREEEPRRADRLELRARRGQVVAGREIREGERDRARRADLRASSVPDAACAMDDDGLAMKEVEHAVLGAGLRTGAAADALREVDVRMDEPGLVAAVPDGVVSLALDAFGAAELVAPSHEHRDRGSEDDQQKRRTDDGDDDG